MLTNTLKRLAYWARSIKKPPTQPPPHPQSSPQQPSFSHSISPTLKKIDKRFNDAQQKYIQEQQQIMKGLEEFKHAMVKQSGNRKKSKQDKILQAQKRLQSLQLPPDLKRRFMQLSKNHNDSTKQKININTGQQKNLEAQMQEKQLMGMFQEESLEERIKSAKISGNFKTEEEAEMMKRMLFENDDDPLTEQRLRQDMMINQILKDSKAKEAELNLPKDWKKQVNEQKKLKQEQESLLNEKLRYQKLKQLSQKQGSNTSKSKPIQSNSQLRKLDKINDKYKIQVSADELWRQQYPPQLIEKALEYKNKQLHYFKQLIEGDHRHEWDAAREKPYMKGLKKDQDRKRHTREIVEAAEAKSHEQLGVSMAPVQEEGLTRYKDLQYYKEKGVKQFQKLQSMHEYDIELRQGATKDIKQLNKLSGIYLDEYQDRQQYRLQKKELYQQSSFGKYEIRLKALSKKMSSLGIEHEWEDLALLKKEELFADKSMQEENASYKQYLIKKEKKKHMTEELKKVHKQQLREDLNFDYQMDPVKLQKLDPLDMEEGLRKMQQIRKLKESTVVSSDFLREKIHHMKTFKAMSQFITGYFYNKLANPNNTITQKVEIGNIYPNRKNTVLNIFWQFQGNYTKLMEKYQFNQDDIAREKKALQKLLQKQSTYISSKMTLYLQLRYGPDIRFYFNQILQQTRQSQREMLKYKDEIIELTVQEYKEKGLIKTQEQEVEYRRKIEALATNNLEDLNNQKKLISKTFKKKQRLNVKMEVRKEQKDKKKAQQSDDDDFKIKRKLSEKQLSEMTLQKIITEKVQAKKESIFTSYIEDEELVFGDKGSKEYLTEQVRRNVGVQGHDGKSKANALNMGRRQKMVKRSPVERLWDDIEKGV